MNIYKIVVLICAIGFFFQAYKAHETLRDAIWMEKRTLALWARKRRRLALLNFALLLFAYWAVQYVELSLMMTACVIAIIIWTAASSLIFAHGLEKERFLSQYGDPLQKTERPNK